MLGCRGSIIPFWSDGRNNNGDLDIYSATVSKSELTDPDFGPVTEAVVWRALYPNPTIDFFTLDFTLKYQSDIRITLYSVSGQVVRTEAFHRAAGPYLEDWSLAGLAAGNYLVELKTDYGRFLKRLVIQ